MRLHQPIRSVQLEATITKADGTVIPQGIVAYSHRNPIRQFWVRLRNPRLRVFGRSGRIRSA